MQKWTEVAADSRYQSAPPELQNKIQQSYFEKVVAPNIPKGMDVERVRSDFLTRANPQPVEPERTIGGTLKDLGNSIKRGAEEIPGIVTGIADIPPALVFGTKPFDTISNYVGEKTGFQPGKWAEDANKDYSPQYQQEQQAIEQAWKDPNATGLDVAKAYVNNPSYTANQVAESLPSMLAGGVVSRGLMVAGRTAEGAGVLERALGEKLAAPIAGGVGEGAIQAGQQMDQYQGEDQRKNAVAAIGSGVIDAVIGAGAGRIANKFGLETAETALAKGFDDTVKSELSIGRRVAGGALSEGVLQELPQSAQEQVWQNYADNKPLWDGVDRSAIEGALAGFAMGAGANIRTGKLTNDHLTISGDAATAAADDAEAARQQAEYDRQEAQSRANAALEGIGAAASVDDAITLATETIQAPLALNQKASPDTLVENFSDPVLSEAELGEQDGDIQPAATGLAAGAIEPGVADVTGSTGNELLERMPEPGLDGRELPAAETQQSSGSDLYAGVPNGSLDTAVIEPGQVQAKVDVGSGAIVTSSGTPYKTETGAQLALQSKGLAGKYDVAPVGEGFGLVQKSDIGIPASATDTAAETSTVQPIPGAEQNNHLVDPNNMVAPSIEQASLSQSNPANQPEANPEAAAVLPLETEQPTRGERIRAEVALARERAAAEKAARKTAGPISTPSVDGSIQVARIGGKNSGETISVKPDGGKLSVLYNGEPVIDFDTEQEVTVPANASIDDIRKAVKASGQFNKQIVTFDKSYVVQAAPAQTDAEEVKGDKINREWTAFADDSGSLGIPRAEMPQIKAEHRGAMANFLNARGITSEKTEVPAADLKPTQAEFSQAKIDKAKKFEGGDRSILVSSDNHVLDGHHQWMAKLEQGETVPVIKLNAPIAKLLQEIKEFPSAETSKGATDPAIAGSDSEADKVKSPAVLARSGLQLPGLAKARSPEVNIPSDEDTVNHHGAGMDKASVKDIVSTIRKNWKNAPAIVVVENMQDPMIRKAVREENDRQLSQGATGQPEGFFDAGKVYVVASEMNSEQDVQRVLFHETLGHFGLRGTFGKDLDPILRNISVARRKEVLAKAKQYGLDPKNSTDMLIAAEEVLAEMAQANPELSVVQRALAAIRTWLRENGFNLELTDEEIVRNYLEPARQFVQRGKQKPDIQAAVGAFSRSDDQDMFDAMLPNWGVNPAWQGEVGRVAGNNAFRNKSVTMISDGAVDHIHGLQRGGDSIQEFTIRSNGKGARVGKVTLELKGSLPVALHDIVIDPAHRGEGHAKQTVGALLSIAPERSIGIIEILDSAEGFWRKSGVHTIGYNDGNADLTWRDFAENNHEARGRKEDKRSTFSRSATQGNAGTPIARADFHERERLQSPAGIAQPRAEGNPKPSSTTPASQFALDEETLSEATIRNWQNDQVRWKNQIAALRERGGKVNDLNNVYQAMERMTSRAMNRTEDFYKNNVEDALKQLQAKKLTLDEIGEYLYAMHAKERNAEIKKINPRFANASSSDVGGSGMSDDEAEDIIRGFKKRDDYANIKEAASVFRTWSEANLDGLVEGGLVTPEQAAAMRAKYPNYVPLRGFEEGIRDGDGLGHGAGFSTAKSAIQRALGRGSRAGNPALYIIHGVAEGMLAREKANVGRYLKRLIQENPDDSLWTIDRPEKEPVLGKTASGDDIVVERDLGYDPDREVRFIEKGKVVRIQLKDPLLARAYNNRGMEEIGTILRAATGINSFLREMWTQKNPTFPLVNVIRDIPSGMLYATGEHGAMFAMKMLGNVPSAWKAMWQHAGKKEVTGDMRKWIDQYRLAGGGIGYSMVGEVQSTMDKINRIEKSLGEKTILQALNGGDIKEGAKRLLWKTYNNAVTDLIERINVTFENMTRLAVFKAAKEKGLSTAEAARLSKNATVNFNRRGEKTPNLNAFYLFANAAMQDLRKNYETITQSEHKGQVVAELSSIVALGLMVALLNGDDDDLDNENSNVTSVRFKVGDVTVSIPVAYGPISFCYYLGRSIAKVIQGVDPALQSMRLASALITNISPINPIPNPDRIDGINTIIGTMPTALQFPAQVFLNRNSFGSDMRPDYSENPDAYKTFRGTRNSVYANLSAWMNESTGGTTRESGFIDVSPETLKGLLHFTMGGTGKFFADAAGTSADMLDGESDINQTPVLNRFLKKDGVSTYRARFYRQASEAKDNRQLYNQYKKDDNEAKARQYAAWDYLGKSANSIWKRMNELRDQELALSRDIKMRLSERKRLVADLEKAQIDLSEQFHSDYRQLLTDIKAGRAVGYADYSEEEDALDE